jgi:hypothetical protein
MGRDHPRQSGWKDEFIPKAGRFEAMNYVVVYEKSATGWGAYVPDLPGVIATGRTKEETQQIVAQLLDVSRRPRAIRIFYARSAHAEVKERGSCQPWRVPIVRCVLEASK